MTVNFINIIIGLSLIVILISGLPLIGVPVNVLGAFIIGAAIGLIFPAFEK